MEKIIESFQYGTAVFLGIVALILMIGYGIYSLIDMIQSEEKGFVIFFLIFLFIIFLIVGGISAYCYFFVL